MSNDTLTRQQRHFLQCLQQGGTAIWPHDSVRMVRMASNRSWRKGTLQPLLGMGYISAITGKQIKLTKKGREVRPFEGYPPAPATSSPRLPDSGPRP